MSALSYKNIKTIIEEFATNQPQINNYQRGDLYDANLEKKIDGVYLLYDIVSNSPDISAVGNKRGQIYNLSVWIVDQVSDSVAESNVVDVINECDQIAKDLLAYFFYFNADGYTDLDVKAQLAEGYSIEYIEERMSGLYSGVLLTFGIKSSFNYRRCLSP